MNATTEQRLAWWRDARFGMMITWGIYALEANGEWVQYKRRIPVKEYEKLAARFDPVRFDAGEWVRYAKLGRR
jgi:alpha-L-fucosidase